MSLLIPAALLFALIIPIIFLFYFMRPKRQKRVVSSTLLWQQALHDLQASRPWQRLRITPLLLLQVLAAIVIVLILTRPATFISSPISGDTIIILQASASMQATDVAPSRFEAAKNHIADLIDSMGPGDQMSLITMARTPQAVIAASSDKNRLTAALARVRVTNQDADLSQALSLATSLATGHADAKILVLGDGHTLPVDQPLVVPIPTYYLSIGTDAPHIALLALASRTLSGKLTALAQIVNYSHQQHSIPVELYADGHLVSVQTIVLAAGTNGTLSWSALPPTTRFLHAHLITDDVMQADHDAWAIAGATMHGRALLVTKGNSFLEAALRLQPGLDLFETTPAKYVDQGTFDLTVFDGYVPPSLPSGDLFFVNPPTGSYAFGQSGPEISVSRISAGNDSQGLLSQVDLSSIHTLHVSHQFIPQPWMQHVIVTPETPLLSAGEQENRRIAVLSFDLHDTDLPLQPSFPILMYNLVNWFLPPPVAGNGQIAPATPVTIATWPGAERVTVTGPGQQAITVAPPFPAAVFDATDTPGIYYVNQYVQGQQRQGAFVVNLFDPLQSRLAPTAQLPIIHSQAFDARGAATTHVLHEIWPWIAAFLLLVLCVEWWLFSRAYTLRGTAKQQAAGQQTRSGTASRSNRQAAGIVASLQNRAQQSYQDGLKRMRKATKRLKGRSRGKGKRNVNI